MPRDTLQLTVSDDQFAKLTEERLLLFLSVDLENSTQLKQVAAGQQEQTWLDVVLDFVTGFPAAFVSEIPKQSPDALRGQVAEPRVWKLLGDELVFVVEIKDARKVPIYLDAMVSAIRSWNAEVRQQTRTSPSRRTRERRLLAKGSAWLAEFPVTNAVLLLPGNQEDYVGPSVDAGFRLGKLATPRQLGLSVDLAWLLLGVRTDAPLRFHGRKHLKGVAESCGGYPELTLEVDRSAYQEEEDKLAGKSPVKQDPAQIRALCEAYIREHGVPSHPPFVPPGDASVRPADYDARKDEVRERLKTLLALTGKAPAATTPPPGAPSSAELLAEVPESRPGA
jgi:hypothetical protein